MNSRMNQTEYANRSGTENENEDSNRTIPSRSSFVRSMYEFPNDHEGSNPNHRFHPNHINGDTFNANLTNNQDMSRESNRLQSPLSNNTSNINNNNDVLENLQRSFNSQERPGQNLYEPTPSPAPILNRPVAMTNQIHMPIALHMSSDTASHQDTSPGPVLGSGVSSDYTESFGNMTEYERFIYTKFSGKLDEDLDNNNDDSDPINVPFTENSSQQHSNEERNQVPDRRISDTYNQNYNNDSALTNFNDSNQSVPHPSQIQSSFPSAVPPLSQTSSMLESSQYSNPSSNTHRPPIFQAKQSPSIHSTITHVKKPNISGLTTTSFDPSFQKIKIPESMIGERRATSSARMNVPHAQNLVSTSFMSSDTARSTTPLSQNTNNDNGFDYERHYIRCLKCKEELRVHKLVSLVICPCCGAVTPNTKIEDTMTMISKCTSSYDYIYAESDFLACNNSIYQFHENYQAQYRNNN